MFLTFKVLCSYMVCSYKNKVFISEVLPLHYYKSTFLYAHTVLVKLNHFVLISSFDLILVYTHEITSPSYVSCQMNRSSN